MEARSSQERDKQDSLLSVITSFITPRPAKLSSLARIHHPPASDPLGQLA